VSLPQPALPVSPAKTESLSEERVRAVFGAGLVPYVTVIVNGGLVWLVLQGPRVSPGFFWWLALLTLSLVRAAAWRSFRDHGFSRRDATTWRRFLAAAAVSNGLLWGASALLLYDSGSLPHQSLLAFVLAGMTAGAVVFSSADPPLFVCFALPALLPLTARFAAEGDTLHGAMAFMTALFGVALSQLTLSSGKKFAEAWALRAQNVQLIAQLTATNEGLERQVIERTQALDRSLVEQRRAGLMASLGRLASGIAHEVNSPLAIIHSNLQVLAHDASVENRELMQDMLQASARIRNVVAELRDLSHAESETTETTALQPLIVTCTHLVESRLRGVGRLEQDLTDGPAVRGTRKELSHLVLQLLLHAAESLSRQHPAQGLIRVSLRPDLAGHCAVLAVEDNGAGLAAADLPTLFEPFADLATERPRGMELAICHAIASSLGGSISAEAAVPNGTRLTVRLPMA
jgi:signal transduction histidine kinase